MDIPKRPVSSSSHLTPKLDSKPSSPLAISSLQDLKLEAGRSYQAIVVSANDTKPKGTKPNEANTQKAATSNKEYIAQVMNKTIVVRSDKALESGQRLSVALDPASTTEKPSLLVKMLNTKANTPLNSAQLGYVLSSSQTGLANGSLDTTQALDKASVKTLLQALNVTLDKQIPLQQGFDQISTLLAKIASSPQASSSSPLNDPLKTLTIDTHLANALKQIILERLPKTNELFQTTTASATTLTTQTSANYVKQSLQNSGLFFEQKLLSTPEKINAFRDQLNSLNQSLNQANTTSLTQSSSQHPALANIRKTIESLLQLTSTTSNKTETLKSSLHSNQAQNDLKAGLLSATALLIKELAQTLSDSELKQLFLGQLQENLGVSPFAFPIINSARSPQSKALFDSPELTTGQLLKLLAGMIHKLQFNQLSSLMQSNSGNDSALQQSWFFELPLLNTNQSVQTFNFRVDKEHKESSNESNTHEKELQWKMILSFDLSPLGPVYVQISLSKNTISPILWADRQETLALLQKESAYLKSQLESIGLTVEDIFCQQGKPSSKQAQLDRHLVDTKA